MSKQQGGEVLKKLSRVEAEALRKKHQESLRSIYYSSNSPAVDGSKLTLKRNRIVGLTLGLTVLGMYLYTMYAVKQEDFLDKELKQDSA